MMEKWILRRVLDEFVKYVRNSNLEDNDNVDIERVQYYDRISDKFITYKVRLEFKVLNSKVLVTLYRNSCVVAVHGKVCQVPKDVEEKLMKLFRTFA